MYAETSTLLVPASLAVIGLIFLIVSFIPQWSYNAEGRKDMRINYGLKGSGVIFLLCSMLVLYL